MSLLSELWTESAPETGGHNRDANFVHYISQQQQAVQRQAGGPGPVQPPVQAPVQPPPVPASVAQPQSQVEASWRGCAPMKVTAVSPAMSTPLYIYLILLLLGLVLILQIAIIKLIC